MTCIYLCFLEKNGIIGLKISGYYLLSIYGNFSKRLRVFSVIPRPQPPADYSSATSKQWPLLPVYSLNATFASHKTLHTIRKSEEVPRSWLLVEGLHVLSSYDISTIAISTVNTLNRSQFQQLAFSTASQVNQKFFQLKFSFSAKETEKNRILLKN